ncbi:MAG: lipopolysaccharide heptosyltransferase II [Candidatus Wallbacteria bacterium]|nr:lipopolysaccharide heptosyltransferase II [Candidatus Wallbacteria bacterium]
MVNSLVLANALKRAWPDCFIGWAVHPKARGVLEGHPAIGEIHCVESLAPAALRRTMEEVRSRGYSIAIDMQHLFKSGLIAFLSGAPRRIGFDFNRTRELSWLFTNDKLPPHDPQRHVVEQYLEFARHLGIDDARPEWRLSPSAAARERAELLLPDGRSWAVLHVGAGKPANRWHAPGWARLARGLSAQHGLSVALVGGPGEADAAREILALLPPIAPPLDLVGKTSLEELTALLERARVVVSCDSGPMHVAAALSRPVVALFGPANHLRTGPYGQMNHVVARQDLWCSPCFRKKPCSHYECMPGIHAQQVVEKVAAVLRERPA